MNQSDWIQRYVDNVRTYLPAPLRDDVGSELLSDLLDQRDDLQATLGRTLTEQEVVDLLKQRGHPMAVAADYQPRRTLVSEPLFPVYVQVLKWTLMVIAVVTAAGTVWNVLADASPNLVSAVIGWFASFYEGGIHAVAWVTLVFYLTGEGLGYRQVFSNWNPRSMPRVVESGKRIKRFDASIEFVVTLLAMAWLNDVWFFAGNGSGSALVLSPALQSLLPWINIALGASVLISLYKLLSPFWTPARLWVNCGVNILWLVMLVVVFQLDTPISVEWRSGEFWQPGERGWQAGVGVVIALTAWDLLENLRGLIRARARVTS